MTGEAEPNVYASNDIALVRIAEAFELTPDDVQRDRSLVAGWTGGEAELLAWLRERHAWDASIPPYYVAWLRNLSRQAPA